MRGRKLVRDHPPDVTRKAGFPAVGRAVDGAHTNVGVPRGDSRATTATSQRARPMTKVRKWATSSGAGYALAVGMLAVSTEVALYAWPRVAKAVLARSVADQDAQGWYFGRPATADGLRQAIAAGAVRAARASGPARRLALTLPPATPTLARVSVLARAFPARAVKRETGRSAAPQSCQPVLPPQR
ncbi:hypothetical protein WJ63_07355 [Burkholderia pyrrocinia]|nr:hypothetical protein WJ63_07355 [Burkholderia pyrrocinia]